jgi:hypothetical protein
MLQAVNASSRIEEKRFFGVQGFLTPRGTTKLSEENDLARSLIKLKVSAKMCQKNSVVSRQDN